MDELLTLGGGVDVLSTTMGERGGGLSGGSASALASARADVMIVLAGRGDVRATAHDVARLYSRAWANEPFAAAGAAWAVDARLLDASSPDAVRGVEVLEALFSGAAEAEGVRRITEAEALRIDLQLPQPA